MTPAGKGLVRACDQLGVMIDVSHLNEEGGNECQERREQLQKDQSLKLSPQFVLRVQASSDLLYERLYVFGRALSSIVDCRHLGKR